MSQPVAAPLAAPEAITSLRAVFEALKLELEAMLEEPNLSALFDPTFIASADAVYRTEVAADVDALIQAATDRPTDDALVAHGLSGPQLPLKMTRVQRTVEERNAILQSVSDGKYGKAPTLLGTAQKNMLEAFDLILDSFFDALNIGGMTKEFKKLFEQAL
jgi:hypothetical protein